MYSINRNVVFREIEDRIVFKNPDSGHYSININEIGRLILTNILNSKDNKHFLEEIIAKYEIKKVRDDVNAFLTELEKENFLIKS